MERKSRWCGVRRPWARSVLFATALLLSHGGGTHGKTINAYIQTSLREFSDIYLGQVRARFRLPVGACLRLCTCACSILALVCWKPHADAASTAKGPGAACCMRANRKPCVDAAARAAGPDSSRSTSAAAGSRSRQQPMSRGSDFFSSMVGPNLGRRFWLHINPSLAGICETSRWWSPVLQTTGRKILGR
jgi:hypothetical protein